jgi:probable rRNA maturation factor
MSGGAPKRAETPDINVRNLQRKVRIDLPALQMFAGRALTVCLAHRPSHKTQLRKLREISILLISDRRMAALHGRFLKKSGPTDVITFDHGEIFISAETARKHARAFNSSVLRETKLYIIHGLLHLHGFDDRTKADARRMEKMQNKVLKQISGARGRGD